MKKTLKSIEQVSTVKTLETVKTLSIKGGAYLPPPGKPNKPGNA